MRAGIILGGVSQTFRQMQLTSALELRNPWTGKVQRMGLMRAHEQVVGNALMNHAIAAAGGAHPDA